MPIEVPNEGGGAGSPIVKKKFIGQKFIGVICDAPEMRQQTKADGELKWKDKEQTKPKRELVVTLLTMPGNTAPVSIGGETHIAQPGEEVRQILAGGAWGGWIDAGKALGFDPRIGDIVEQTIEYGQAWSANADKIGPELRTQAECDAVPREQSLGMYGPLTVRAAEPHEAEWDAKACQFYNDKNRPTPTVAAAPTAAEAVRAAPSADDIFAA